jgi:cytidylate kinase
VSELPLIVAVDGTAGSGKSSVCSGASKKLGWAYVNTGAFYRAAGVIFHRFKKTREHEAGLSSEFMESLNSLRWEPKTEKIWWGGEDLTSQLQQTQVAKFASDLAKNPQLRQVLLPIQRQAALQAPYPGVIVDGRDIGSTVFPQACLKIFMTAPVEARALRRFKQLKANNTAALSLEELMTSIEKRDIQDQSRDIAPLQLTKEALTFENNYANYQLAVEALVKLITLALP